MHIVHISSVHNSNDPRIRRKQLRSVVSTSGWRATFITGDLCAVEGDGVGVVRVYPGNGARLSRLLVTAPYAVFKAFLKDADVYHFHDPELIPWAWLLRVKGRPVVYDIHEDYVTSVRQKRYLPSWMRSAAVGLVDVVERLGTGVFHRVIAERYYSRRFPSAEPILNYPSSELLETGDAFDPKSFKVLYTGNVTLDRGALQMARLLRAQSKWSVTAIGRCPEGLAAAMREEAGPRADHLRLVGEGHYIPFEDILGAYRAGGWLAGIALFPDTEHYREKELTKFFEYMAVGLPIVASDFPVWRELLVGNRVGLCVDPENPSAVEEALNWLRSNPQEAQAMGARGRELVRSVFNWEQEGERLIGFYKRVSGKQFSCE